MAITKQKKEEIVSKMSGIAGEAKTIVFARFRGLNVAAQNEMRKALRAQDIGYTVAKKSLVRRALDSKKFEGEMPTLDGEIGLAYDIPPGADELAPARELAVFVKKYPDMLSFAGGVFGGKYVNQSEIISIASIPGMQQLRGQLVQLFNSPIQRFATVMHENAKQQS
jgi:large subunit ribosomal protein L10